MSQAPALSSTLTLADTPNSVAWARRHVVDMLRGWGVCSEETVDTARLVVSELVTNAVRHPGTEVDRPLSCSDLESVSTVALVLEATDSMVRISVRDHDPAPPMLKEVGVEATGGRGIFLVAQLSTRWGHYLCRPGPDKVVWAEVPLVSGGTVAASRSSTTDCQEADTADTGLCDDPQAVSSRPRTSGDRRRRRQLDCYASFGMP